LKIIQGKLAVKNLAPAEKKKLDAQAASLKSADANVGKSDLGKGSPSARAGVFAAIALVIAVLGY
jgi:hypothetical protein